MTKNKIEFYMNELNDKYIISLHGLSINNGHLINLGTTEILTITTQDNLIENINGSLDIFDKIIRLDISVKNNNPTYVTHIELTFKDQHYILYDNDNIRFIIMRPMAYNIHGNAYNNDTNRIFHLDKLDELQFITMLGCL